MYIIVNGNGTNEENRETQIESLREKELVKGELKQFLGGREKRRFRGWMCYVTITSREKRERRNKMRKKENTKSHHNRHLSNSSF